MNEYTREVQETIPENEVKVIGVGGAGANVVDRAVMEGVKEISTLVVNTDERNLHQSMAGEKIQLGKDLLKGLGTGGDPDMGLKATQESLPQIRTSLKNQKIVFVCVGLGGGTGSAAAPIITRVAREQGAFVVVFATMPFSFEGARRREQAETSLTELSVLANALITFDNGKMGELVLSDKGIMDAFKAADVMISQSIMAVTRLILKPGIVNIGLDELSAALKTTKSRCLFGSGIASGKDRCHVALQHALESPLLDKGSLLKSATTVLVHICGGPSLSLYEVELLMQELGKQVQSSAHIMFGVAVDEALGDQMSITLISALPESLLLSKNLSKDSTGDDQKKNLISTSQTSDSTDSQPEEKKKVPFWVKKQDVEQGGTNVIDSKEITKEEVKEKQILAKSYLHSSNVVTDSAELKESDIKGKTDESDSSVEIKEAQETPTSELDEEYNAIFATLDSDKESDAEKSLDEVEVKDLDQDKGDEKLVEAKTETLIELPGKQKEVKASAKKILNEKDSEEMNDIEEDELLKSLGNNELSKNEDEEKAEIEKVAESSTDDLYLGFDFDDEVEDTVKEKVDIGFLSKIKSKVVKKDADEELDLEGKTKGKFSGAAPNLFDGEDLDLPPEL